VIKTKSEGTGTCNDALTRGPRPAPTTINTFLAKEGNLSTVRNKKVNQIKLGLIVPWYIWTFKISIYRSYLNKYKVQGNLNGQSLTVFDVEASSSGTLSSKALQTARWYCTRKAYNKNFGWRIQSSMQVLNK